MKRGFIFPGQGSQSIGMLADIAREFPIVTETFAEASDVLGYDLWQLTQSGPQEELDKTAQTQPALLTASYAIWRILQPTLATPSLLAGHSLGEYTALVCAGSLAFPDAVKIVAKRGEFMQAAVPAGQGALAAIVGLDNDAVKELCDAVAQGEVLAPANYNSPGQVVIAGQAAAVARALVAAKEKGAKLAKQLPVSVPSHSILMEPAAIELAALLQTTTIHAPQIPVVNNVDVMLYSTADSIRDGLVRQLSFPVRWVEVIEYFAQQGIQQITEVGPGKVLNGLGKRIASDVQFAHTADVESVRALLTGEK